MRYHPFTRVLFILLSCGMLLPNAVFAFTEAQCNDPKLNATCRVTCDDGEQEIGGCTDNILQVTCCSRGKLKAGTSGVIDESKGLSGCSEGYTKYGDCCAKVKTPAIGSNGEGEVRSVDCAGKPTYYVADCYCKIGDKIARNGPGQDYATCVTACKKLGGEIDTSSGVGVLGQQVSAPPTRFKNALCFTPEECSDQKGTFAGNVNGDCAGKLGRCIAPEPTIKLSSPVLGVSEVSGLRNYIPLMFNYALSISMVVAAIMFVVAGFKYVLGASAGTIGQAKEDMINATVGLVLLFGAQTLLGAVNRNILDVNKLTVYMISQSQFSLNSMCSDYKKGGQFADLSGNTLPQDPGALTYDKTVEQTLCGKWYLPKDIARACQGSSCPLKSQICASCASGRPDCLGKTDTSICVKAILAGDIRWDSKIYPTRITLLPVCNWIEDNKGSRDVIKNNLFGEPVVIEKSQIQGTADVPTGVASYSFSITKQDLAKAKPKCDNGNGGLRGFVLAVEYNNICSLYKETIAGYKSGEKLDKSWTQVATALGNSIVNGVDCASSGSDTLIVRKSDCGNDGSKYFEGYSNGSDPRNAVFCGGKQQPQLRPANSFASLAPGGGTRVPYPFKEADMWKASDLDAIISDQAAAVACNIYLNSFEAPPSPGTLLMGGYNCEK